jgi:phosphoglycerate dehydrogenase-like enzyme
LRGLHEAFLQPHLGGPTDDEAVRAGSRLLGNLEQVAAHKTPPDAVSLVAYDRAT